MSWTLRDRLLWKGADRLTYIGRHKDPDGMREALRVHGVDPLAIEQIGETLLTVVDVLFSDDMPAGTLRTRAEMALYENIGREEYARDFAASWTRAKLLALTYQPPKRKGRVVAPARVKLGAKTVDAICAAFRAWGLPLRGEEGHEQLFLDAPGMRPEQPIGLEHRDPVLVMREALIEIASGRATGSASGRATRALKLARDIDEARRGQGG
jgi:hypothetical protein